MYQLTVAVSKQEQDYYEELLFAMGAQSVSGKQSEHETVLTALFDSLSSLKKLNLPLNLQIAEIDETMWKYNWIKGLKGSEVSKTIYVQPVTEKNYSIKNDYRYFLLLDPGDAFGDGQHPTTRMCLRLLERGIASLPDEQKEQCSMIDAGCGSGLLAILADKMGIGHIDAIDTESSAVKNTERNCLLNRCNNVTALVADISQFTPDRKYTIVCANVLTAVILANIDRLILYLKEDGVMIISGISTIWAEEIKGMCSSRRLVVREEAEDNGWCAFVLSLF